MSGSPGGNAVEDGAYVLGTEHEMGLLRVIWNVCSVSPSCPARSAWLGTRADVSNRLLSTSGRRRPMPPGTGRLAARPSRSTTQPTSLASGRSWPDRPPARHAGLGLLPVGDSPPWRRPSPNGWVPGVVGLSSCSWLKALAHRAPGQCVPHVMPSCPRNPVIRRADLPQPRQHPLRPAAVVCRHGLGPAVPSLRPRVGDRSHRVARRPGGGQLAGARRAEASATGSPRWARHNGGTVTVPAGRHHRRGAAEANPTRTGWIHPLTPCCAGV